MTAYPIGWEVACDGPAPDRDCPASAAITASLSSLGAAPASAVRADGRALGWTTRRRPGGGPLLDLCPSCAKERTR
ncbi:hypothetical protein [Streptomyces sp. Tu6071]|uniref:hypothetical protein n=1 Tax=Streptomyces sp. Tu6071 TaxID=355249 RepID=UPI0002D33E50|nr:hypothetical protein [Streptomyces sp. Tu6071]